MTKTIECWNDIEASASVAFFAPDGKVGEAHAILQIESLGDLFEAQAERLLEAERRLMTLPRIEGMQTVFKRYFLSDAVNQTPLLPHTDGCAAISFIQQPPLNGSKIAVWIYYVQASGEELTRDGRFTVLCRNGYEHFWAMGYTHDEGDSHTQAEAILQSYAQDLQRHGATIADNCLRTWFFVRDVDIQYDGLVVARREFFDRIGLTRDTHYLASTGIGGFSASRKAIHQMGTYAAKGLLPEQIAYLQAADNMNRTSDYGVTFERATKVTYGDRSHILVSGTASIDNRGQVVHPGDIVSQTYRMWENVGALLAEGSHSWDDVMQIIVYLRDIADAATVEEMFAEKFPDTPFVITLAPVCRPGWLIEMECISVSEADTAYPAF